MILIDANLLVYAVMEGMPQHVSSRKWLEATFQQKTRIGLPWTALLAFVRIASNRKIFESPIPILSAWEIVENWLAHGAVWIPEPGPRHEAILKDLLARIGSNSNLVPDAHLAALAIEHQLALYSADRGFARFPDLQWINPLVS